MSQQNRKIDIDSVVCVADSPDLLRRLFDSDKRAEQVVLLGLRQNRIGNDTDKKDFHAVKLHDIARRK